MLLVPDVQGVATQQVEQLLEGVGRAVGDGGRHDGGWAEEAFAVEAREDFGGRTEEDGEAEGEVVG